MPVRMRLHRVGAKHQPSYRIVVTPALTPRDGSYLDQVGFYNPRTEPATLRIDTEKVVDWLKKGVQPSDRVVRLLENVNIVPAAIRRGEPIPTEPIVKKDRRTEPKRMDEPAPEGKKSKKAAAAGAAPAPAPTEPVTETGAASATVEEPADSQAQAATLEAMPAAQSDASSDSIDETAPDQSEAAAGESESPQAATYVKGDAEAEARAADTEKEVTQAADGEVSETASAGAESAELEPADAEPADAEAIDANAGDAEAEAAATAPEEQEPAAAEVDTTPRSADHGEIVVADTGVESADPAEASSDIEHQGDGTSTQPEEAPAKPKRRASKKIQEPAE